MTSTLSVWVTEIEIDEGGALAWRRDGRILARAVEGRGEWRGLTDRGDEHQHGREEKDQAQEV